MDESGVSPVDIIPPWLSILISRGGCRIGQLVAAVQIQETHPIDMNNMNH
jgi:hypothetical protein